ncbi:lipid-A-disaccharide synthase [Pseudomonas sp. FW306-02-F02-AA]|uniref:ABC transporter substrate-binding protein n=1 Tax=Pseudomonas fluorescens TaxID=294 RepID=A0A0N7GZL5_PSEFL|nr:MULTISPECIES: DUF2076 domain-containing protein [Pseudomonas]ALI00676.1 ABC transporter substrate-binding protein [Pseudomonas fluorescens]PMZ04542.1 lipid-A-disaccharide synthase [Pseudomonas sp. FW306-02-F02-AB]PMZ08734.1 lipid-A-disaccharide synthase [Pseudomonas sp. FW306-02-H06C]PMZ16269.1 lipid-A-disaccharide synthase [Pseudomonas sp. FW306-02-F02-AA]PMZ22210.1 lipid-A-disaccharide synthase [Pseudomonas sp. FW306-02-F08-AA]
MNSEEQTLIDGLFSRLQQAETDSAPRDALAEARIKEHLSRQPAAGYFMTQAILVQEAAIKSLDEQNKQLTQQIQQLQAELQQARAQASAPAPSSSGGGFLSSIFGGSRDPQPAPAQSAPASSGGWREPARPSAPLPQNYGAPQQGFGAPQQNYAAPPQQAPAAGSSFLGGALKTAAGVAGGVMLAQGISSLFHSNQQQPQEIVEVIKEEPAQVNDNERLANNDSWNNNDQGGFADADDSDDSSFFGGDDDDSFV